VNIPKLNNPTASCKNVASIEVLSVERRIWPFLLEHPKDRISFYINNADALMKQSLPIQHNEPKYAINSLSKAEHNMTLMVNELRKISNTSLTPYSMIFDAFTRQNIFLAESENQTLIDIALRNEKSAKTMYLNGLPAGQSVLH